MAALAAYNMLHDLIGDVRDIQHRVLEVGILGQVGNQRRINPHRGDDSRLDFISLENGLEFRRKTFVEGEGRGFGGGVIHHLRNCDIRCCASVTFQFHISILHTYEWEKNWTLRGDSNILGENLRHCNHVTVVLLNHCWQEFLHHPPMADGVDLKNLFDLSLGFLQDASAGADSRVVDQDGWVAMLLADFRSCLCDFGGRGDICAIEVDVGCW